jgi:P27 family predicted phage terminase small subunit
LDGDALACYCQAWSEFEIATKLLRKEGRTVVMSKTGYVSAHPAIAMQRSAWSAVKSFAALLGLDPSSRQSLPERYPDGEVEAPPDHLRYFDGDAL